MKCITRIRSAVTVGAVLFALASPTTSTANASNQFTLSGSPFETAAVQSGVDPLLLYALTLVESNDTAPSRGIAKGSVAPWPYTLREPSRAYRYDTKEEALEAAKEILLRTEVLDIGWAQVNWRWHKENVRSLEDLLDPLYNLQYASQYLQESMALAPNDPALGIGYYHIRANKDRARNYGERVLAVKRNLETLTSAR